MTPAVVVHERELLADLNEPFYDGLPVAHRAIQRQARRLAAAKRRRWQTHQPRTKDGRPLQRAAV